MSKRIELERAVAKFTSPTFMKFQPVEDLEEPEEETKPGIFTRIRNYFSPPKSPKKGLQRANSLTEAMKSSSTIRQSTKPKIKFVKKLTNEHVIVGNEDQIDAMSISGIVSQFVDTEYLWSLKIKQPIVQVAVDCKKNLIVLLAVTSVHIFSYDYKFLHLKPQLVSAIALNGSPKYLHVLREGVFSICFQSSLQIYSVDEVSGVRMTLRKNLELPIVARLFQVPEPYQNTLNIFFEEDQPHESSFSLWCISIEFYQKEVKMNKALKIYDIPKYLKPYSRLQNYSKTIFLINLGKDIYAVRKGYVIDVASVNIQAGNNYLRYLSNNKLIHVTDTKVEVYNFSINQNVHPPRIIVESTDSIQIPSFSDHYQYVSSLEVLGDNFAVFYQLKPEHNKLLKGETKYTFIVTHVVKFEDKLRNILPLDKVDVQSLEERADMAHKMGMERKEIYLRLWNNSNKTDIEDYKLLLDTLDYETIKNEIQKKLKKTSMNYREIYLLEQGCMAMLHSNVFSNKNSKEDIKNYLISNTLSKKLELYKHLTIEDKNQGKPITEDPSGRLLINIQNYNYFKTVDIKNLLFELIARFVNEDKQEVSKIRILFKLFKFSIRLEYRTILANTIASTKKKFLKLLQAIPELLPYKPSGDEDIDDYSLVTGIWSPISEEEWEQNLYIDTVMTLDNRENLQEVCQSVWYKRYWMTQHDYINKTRAEIKQIQEVNSSYQTFYLCFQKLFEHIKEYQPIREIIDFIQDTYESMPQHIYGKIFLYRKLFDHFKENRHIKELEEIQNFSLFLKLKDEDLFKIMFNFEKVKKGFILKEIKPLYQKLSCVEVFNQGLLNYFASPKSQISDIKYILNRLNNEKREFHEENQGIYEVLVRGMQLKLRLGSQEDIPIDEVLIYIQNIPIFHQTSIEADLLLMKRINQYSQRFKSIKLNMTIFDMTKNMDNVIAALIHQDIAIHNVTSIRDYNQLKEKTMLIIEDVENIKEMIYPEQGHHQLTLFIYLEQLLQYQELISLVATLLQDEELNSKFTISQILVENIVIYSYKLQMTNNPSYQSSTPYLLQLVTLLSQENPVKMYIEAEIELSEMLSCSELTVFYPLSDRNQHFTSRELQNLIAEVNPLRLQNLNIQKLYECSLKIQQLSTDKTLCEITLHGVYEMVIYRFIDCNLLQSSIPKIKTLIELQGDSPYNFIYPSLLVAKIAPQMIEENRNLLLKCSTHLFRNPMKLVDLLEEIMKIEATSSEYKELILSYYLQVKFETFSYCSECFLIDKEVLNMLDSEDMKRNFIPLLRYSLYNLLGQKEQFGSQPEYYIIFIILINDPYVLIKYIYQNRFKINFKILRCYLSYLIKEPLFHKVHVLEFGKRLFYTIYESVNNNRNLEEVIEEMRKRDIDNPLEMIKVHTPRSELERKLIEGIERMRVKLKTVKTEINKRKNKSSYNEAARLDNIRQRLLNPRSKEGNYQYPFIDSDDTARTDDLLKREDKKKVIKQEKFDSKYQRYSLLNRSDNSLSVYMSVEKQKKHRKAYYTKKFTQDAIYGSLTIEKNFAKQIQEAITKTFERDEVMSPRRKLRLAKIESQSQVTFTKLKEEMRKSRSRAINEITTEERLVIEKEEQQILNTPVVSIIGNLIEESAVLVKIITPDMQITEQTEFNFEELEPYRASQRFSLLLRQLITLTFANDTIPFRGVLIFVKKLNQTFVETKITKEWIEIYMRAQALQNKFKLDLPLRNIFTVDGLFLDSEISQNLFHFLLPMIVRNVNDQNILKLCKVVNLAFKKTQLQQEILYYYLIQLLRIYQESIEAIDTTEEDLKMQKEKFKMIINKIPTKYLFQKESDLIKIFREEAIRKEIVNMFIQSFRNRYDMKAADAMYDKYIMKVKRIKRN